MEDNDDHQDLKDDHMDNNDDEHHRNHDLKDNHMDDNDDMPTVQEFFWCLRYIPAHFTNLMMIIILRQSLIGDDYFHMINVINNDDIDHIDHNDVQ